MTTFTTRTITSTRHEWAVPAAEPWGATYEEVVKAVSVAWVKYRELHGLPEDAAMPGDFARFHVTDDEVVVAFTVEEQQR